ncbi:MAG TPA: ImmA/IrrE family metallo-endopeptidase [Lacipirellulaceae bacterium]|nr:ImmA/IrrE family metallo-endopeptidase [Lacipirellulaceae bacterium]HMP05130.1 ImmA/IrrE family metallo-endopeptidase [Lacipirellulaceae bacterium]
MYCTHLTEAEAADIDAQVGKVLRGLGNPEPPLRLDDVRELLRLDLQYYSLSGTDHIQETVSRLKIAGKQILRRPTLLLDAIRKRDLKALWVPDRKRILIDKSLPKLKWRWSEGHEIGHSIIPWHQDMLHGDDKRTLTPSTEQHLEAEANYAAGRLLFLRGEFDERLHSGPVDYAAIDKLSKEFGNTKTTTLWRAVESLAVPAFGMVTQHPAKQADPDRPLIRYFVRSQLFAEQFASVERHEFLASLRANCRGGRGPIGEMDILLSDERGRQHVFHMTAFHNSYETLVFGVHRHARRMALAV